MGYDHFRYARRIDADTIGIYHSDMTRMLTLDKSGVTNFVIEGQDGHGLILYPNPLVRSNLNLANTGTVTITALVDKDLFLTATGTGNVKFGTHAATGDVAIDGNIPIKDAAGNARKLATVA